MKDVGLEGVMHPRFVRKEGAIEKIVTTNACRGRVSVMDQRSNLFEAHGEALEMQELCYLDNLYGHIDDALVFLRDTQSTRKKTK